MKIWKDRGWWVMVEILRGPGCRKNVERAIAFLDAAGERYDLVLENGQTASRGIFTSKEAGDQKAWLEHKPTSSDDLLLLSALIGCAAELPGSKIFVRGDRLDAAGARVLARMLACVARDTPCRGEVRDERWSFLGCHLIGVGLLNYSLQALKAGDKFWFSFLRREAAFQAKWNLCKFELLDAFRTARLCPLFPQETGATIERLPAAIDLERESDRGLWVETGRMLRTRWLCRFPPVVPYSETKYQQWITSALGL